MRTIALCLVAWCALASVFCDASKASDISDDEEVLFFPTYGRQEDGNWIVPIHGWIYEPEENDFLRRHFLRALARSLGLKEEDAETEVFRRRARLFLVDNERGKEVTIRLGGKLQALGESSVAGHFRGTVRLSAEEAQELLANGREGWIDFEAEMPDEDPRRFQGQALLIGETGISVVSDIDDTIKVTEVRDRAALLANTFRREFRPVADMAPLYQEWRRRGAVFHYVSASPWHLYAPLEAFRKAHGFPPGTFHLKDFRAKDASFVGLFASPEQSKRRAIIPLLEAFPRRRFILVGDSGERDPEIYGALAREHPWQIVRILIRDVTGEGREAERYRKAFEGLPKERWQVFAEPKEVEPWPSSLLE